MKTLFRPCAWHKALSALVVLALGVSTSAFAADFRHQSPYHTTVDLPQARATALQFKPGYVTRENLERYRGGSGLRYTFNIRSNADARLYKVGVDTDTGMIVENKLRR